VETILLEEIYPRPPTRRRTGDGYKTRLNTRRRSQVQARKLSSLRVDHLVVITTVTPKPNTRDTLKCYRRSNVCNFTALTTPLLGCQIKELFNLESALYLLSEKKLQRLWA